MTNRNVSVNVGWLSPILVVGLVLRFATDSSTVWNGIHVQKAGDLLILIAVVPVLLFFGFLLILGLIFAASFALGHWGWYTERKRRKRMAKARENLAKRRYTYR